MTEAESRELRAQMVQTRIRFVKACDAATTAIRQLIETWQR